MCKELEKWPDSAKPTMPVVRRANSVINQPVLCQGSCSVMFKAVWPAWSRQAHAIHLWALGAITRTLLKQCLPCAELGFKSRFQRRKYLGEESEVLLSFRSYASPVMIFTVHCRKGTDCGLSDWLFPCLLCGTVVLELFLLDEPCRPTVTVRATITAFLSSLDHTLTENGQNMSHSE